jgi:hypothetical protein
MREEHNRDQRGERDNLGKRRLNTQVQRLPALNLHESTTVGACVSTDGMETF